MSYGYDAVLLNVEDMAMKITKDMVGKKVTYKTTREWWIKVLYVGKNLFFGEHDDGMQSVSYLDNNPPWELIEEKKKYAPAFIRYSEGGRYFITDELFSSLEEAKEACGHGLYVYWPALPNAEGYYEIGE